MRIAIVVNADAWSVRGRAARGTAWGMERPFRRHGHSVSIKVTEGSGLAHASKVAAEGAEAVVVAGGDGSVNTALGALVGSGAACGVIPLGRRNHFARRLGIPLDPAEAAASLAVARIVPFDFAEVNGHLFHSWSLLGAPIPWSGQLGRPPAILASLWRKGTDWRPNLIIDRGGIPEVTRTLAIEVAVKYGVANRTEDECGHTLHIAAVRAPSAAALWFGWAAHFRLVRPVVERFILPECLVLSRKPVVSLVNDGEPVESETPLHYRLRPAAISILVPDQTRAATERRRWSPRYDGQGIPGKESTN